MQNEAELLRRHVCRLRAQRMPLDPTLCISKQFERSYMMEDAVAIGELNEMSPVG